MVRLHKLTHFADRCVNPCPQWFMEGGALPLLVALLADEDATCQTKGLLALSCLIRGCHPALLEFRNHDGAATLCTLLRGGNVRAQRWGPVRGGVRVAVGPGMGGAALSLSIWPGSTSRQARSLNASPAAPWQRCDCMAPVLACLLAHLPCLKSSPTCRNPHPRAGSACSCCATWCARCRRTG